MLNQNKPESKAAKPAATKAKASAKADAKPKTAKKPTLEKKTTAKAAGTKKSAAATKTASKPKETKAKETKAASTKKDDAKKATAKKSAAPVKKTTNSSRRDSAKKVGLVCYFVQDNGSQAVQAVTGSTSAAKAKSAAATKKAAASKKTAAAKTSARGAAKVSFLHIWCIPAQHNGHSRLRKHKSHFSTPTVSCFVSRRLVCDIRISKSVSLFLSHPTMPYACTSTLRHVRCLVPLPLRISF